MIHFDPEQMYLSISKPLKEDKVLLQEIILQLSIKILSVIFLREIKTERAESKTLTFSRVGRMNAYQPM
jgi:hypothetical protein